MTLPAAAGPLLAWVLRREGEFTAEPDHGLDAESVRAILTALYREGVVAHGPL
jgi:lysine-specific demethylase/histidyl-hydroxylase NO66